MSHNFKLSQLVAQGNGISSYVNRWTPQDQIKIKQIEVESSDSKCTCLVLGVLAIIAAAGSLALFFYSGNLTNHQVTAFAIGFGILTLGFIGGICYRTVKYMQATKKLATERDELANEEIPFQDALEQMMEASPEQMRAVLDQIEGRVDFIKFVHGRFFGEDGGSLSQNQKSLVQCFNNPNDMAQLVQENFAFNPQFVLEILSAMDPIAAITAESAPANATIRDLMLQVNQLGDEKYPVLAKHPTTLADMLIAADLQSVPQIVAQMTDIQKTAFLKYLALEWVQADATTEEGRGKKARIEQIVSLCIETIVDQNLVCQFVLREGEAAPVLPQEALDLLIQVVRFPEIASRHINQSSEFVTNRVFLDALDRSFDPALKARYIQAIIESERVDPLLVSTMAAAINHYKDPIPELLAAIYKEQPRALYSAKSSVHPDAQAVVSNLLLAMKEEHQKVFQDEEQKLTFSNLFTSKTDTVELVGFAKKIQTDWHAALDFLNANPTRFAELVLNNAHVHSQEALRQIRGFQLLQEMQSEAVEKAIDTMDPNLSFHHFNFLIDRLQILIQEKTRETAGDKLKTLVAIFRYAPDRSLSFFGSIREKFITSTGVMGINRETHSDWELFRELAEEKKEAVWRKK